jgi:hypothetical protein
MCMGWHNMDNSRFHCWPSNASAILTHTLSQYGYNCKGKCECCRFFSYEFILNILGVDVHWIKSPPKQG